MVDVGVTGLPANIIKDGTPINIASEVRNKSDTCSSLSYPFVIVVLANPENTKLPAYMPVEGATINITYGILSKTLTTDQNGIAIYCRPKFGIIAGAIRVKKDGVDFGNGSGVFSDYENLSVFIVATRKFITFRGKRRIPCPTANIPVATSNFDKLESRPSIFTQFKPKYEGYGVVDVVGSNYRLFINNIPVGSGIVKADSKIDHTFGQKLRDIGSIRDLLGESVTVRVEIDHGTCTFAGETTVSLPSITLPKLCAGTLDVKTPTGLSIEDHIADFLSKIKTGTNPNAFPALFLQIESFVNGVKKDIAIELLLDGKKVTLTEPKSNRSQDLIRIIKTLGTKAFDTVHDITINPLIDCAIDPVSFSIPALIPTLPELPKPPSACELWETAANISVPSLLKPPFKLQVSGANWICKDTGKKTPIDAIAEVSIGEREFSLPIKGGSGILTLNEADLMGEVPELPAPKLPAPKTPKLPSVCEKTGKLGEPGKYFVTISEVQSYLSICYPGQGHEAEYAPAGPWYGTFKITRGTATKYPAGSYFWANTWEGIRSTI